MITINIVDKTLSGIETNNLMLDFENENATLRDIITKRILTEVEKYNQKLHIPYFGLITPDSYENTLNNNTVNSKNIVDAEKQIYIALDAFLKNQFFVLINDEQVDNLEQIISVSHIREINFVKLVPLVGG